MEAGSEEESAGTEDWAAEEAGSEAESAGAEEGSRESSAASEGTPWKENLE